jgi:phosphate acetyltransferase
MRPNQLIEKLKQKALSRPGRIAFVEAEDSRIQLVTQALLENKSFEKIYWVGSKIAPSVNTVNWIKPMGDDSPQCRLSAAAELLKNNEVDVVLAGAQYTTADVVRCALKEVGLSAGTKTLSSSFMMLKGDQSLVFADCGVVIRPTLEQLVDIAHSSAQTFVALSSEKARVAFLSFSTRQSAMHDESTRMADAAKLFKKHYPNIISDGEIQFDAAIDPQVANKKSPESPLEGNANVFIFPDLNSGNIAYKIAQRLGGFIAVGPILQGSSKILSDLSRGASVVDIEAAAYINLARARNS